MESLMIRMLSILLPRTTPLPPYELTALLLPGGIQAVEVTAVPLILKVPPMIYTFHVYSVISTLSLLFVAMVQLSLGVILIMVALVFPALMLRTHPSRLLRL